MSEALRIILPVYLAAFFVIAFVIRSYLVWKRTGVNPYVVGNSDRPIDFVENLYPVPAVLLVGATAIFSALPSAYSYLTPITWLESIYVQAIGLFLMGIAIVWTATAQMQMGHSWRIGIDLDNKTELVEKGLFRVSRNPIFLGMRMALWGFFLTLPNAATLVSVVMLDVLIQVQVRLEEEFLRGVHGEAYSEYSGGVRRWI